MLFCKKCYKLIFLRLAPILSKHTHTPYFAENDKIHARGRYHRYLLENISKLRVDQEPYIMDDRILI